MRSRLCVSLVLGVLTACSSAEATSSRTKGKAPDADVKSAVTKYLENKQKSDFSVVRWSKMRHVKCKYSDRMLDEVHVKIKISTPQGAIYRVERFNFYQGKMASHYANTPWPDED